MSPHGVEGASALVTGATGFLGAHLTRLLLASGAAVTAIVRPASDLGRLHAVAGPLAVRAEIRRLPLAPAEAVLAALRVGGARFDAIFHLAGAPRPRASDDEEAELTTIHVGGARVAAELALAHDAPLVAVSTSDVYGKLPCPHDATATPAPRTPYARSKAAADALLLGLHRTRGLRMTIVRPYLVYGPAQSPRQFVPALIAACLDGRAFPMTDGAQRRDFVYVTDVAAALVRAAISERARGRAVDVCTGVPTRVIDAAMAIAAATRPRSGGPLPGAIPRGDEEPDDRYGDPAPAEVLLGFRPEVPLREGIARTVAAFAAGRDGGGAS